MVTHAETQAMIARQKIKWSRIRNGVYWGVAPIGLAYEIERIGIADGEVQWQLREYPNADADTFENVATGPLRDLQRTAVYEAACHALNQTSEAL